MRATHLVLLLAAALAALTPTRAAQQATASAAAGAAFTAAALSVEPGGQLTVQGYQLEGDAVASTLELTRFEVWKSGSKVVVHGAGGAVERPAPATRFFRGAIAGAPHSSAMLSVRASGAVSGVAYRGSQSWVLGRPGAAGAAKAAGAGASATAPGGPQPLRSRLVRLEDRQAIPHTKCSGTKRHTRLPGTGAAQPAPGAGPARKLRQASGAARLAPGGCAPAGRAQPCPALPQPISIPARASCRAT